MHAIACAEQIEIPKGEVMGGSSKPAAPSGGMFAKDKEIGNRIDTEFELREDFVLWGAKVAPDKVDTAIGPASKTVLTVSRLDSPDTVFECTTLASAIAAKAEHATDSEFPCVVQLRKVASQYGNDALVLQYVRPFAE